MNSGLLGVPAKNQTGFYQTPWMPMTRFAVATRYIIPHPFEDLPTMVRQIYRCKIAQSQYLPGMVIQELPRYAGIGDGCQLVLRPYAIELCMGSTGIFRSRVAAADTSIALTPANWDVALLVIK